MSLRSFFLTPLEEGPDVFLGPDLLEHPEDSLAGSTVKRTVECGGRAGHGTVRVNLAGGDMAHGSGRAVELMVGVLKNSPDQTSPLLLPLAA